MYIIYAYVCVYNVYTHIYITVVHTNQTKMFGHQKGIGIKTTLNNIEGYSSYISSQDDFGD